MQDNCPKAAFCDKCPSPTKCKKCSAGFVKVKHACEPALTSARTLEDVDQDGIGGEEDNVRLTACVLACVFARRKVIGGSGCGGGGWCRGLGSRMRSRVMGWYDRDGVVGGRKIAGEAVSACGTGYAGHGPRKVGGGCGGLEGFSTREVPLSVLLHPCGFDPG